VEWTHPSRRFVVMPRSYEAATRFTGATLFCVGDKTPYMIHMGRAFFPKTGYDVGEKWWMTAATDFRQWRSFGSQGW
jgi:hypothetical protein